MPVQAKRRGCPQGRARGRGAARASSTAPAHLRDCDAFAAWVGVVRERVIRTVDLGRQEWEPGIEACGHQRGRVSLQWPQVSWLLGTGDTSPQPYLTTAETLHSLHAASLQPQPQPQPLEGCGLSGGVDGPSESSRASSPQEAPAFRHPSGTEVKRTDPGIKQNFCLTKKLLQEDTRRALLAFVLVRARSAVTRDAAAPSVTLSMDSARPCLPGPGALLGSVTCHSLHR